MSAEQSTDSIADLETEHCPTKVQAPVARLKSLMRKGQTVAQDTAWGHGVGKSAVLSLEMNVFIYCARQHGGHAGMLLIIHLGLCHTSHNCRRQARPCYLFAMPLAWETINACLRHSLSHGDPEGLHSKAQPRSNVVVQPP